MGKVDIPRGLHNRHVKQVGNLVIWRIAEVVSGCVSISSSAFLCATYFDTAILSDSDSLQVKPYRHHSSSFSHLPTISSPDQRSERLDSHPWSAEPSQSSQLLS